MWLSRPTCQRCGCIARSPHHTHMNLCKVNKNHPTLINKQKRSLQCPQGGGRTQAAVSSERNDVREQTDASGSTRTDTFRAAQHHSTRDGECFVFIGSTAIGFKRGLARIRCRSLIDVINVTATPGTKRRSRFGDVLRGRRRIQRAQEKYTFPSRHKSASNLPQLILCER